jgi:GT2 family glycosyltransferase/glycosyltransferase involved in cell wall biosynthesis
MTLRIAALYAAPLGLDYLESSLRSIKDVVDLVLIGVTESSEDAVQEFFIDRPELAEKVEIIHGGWRAGEQCVADLARTIAVRGIPYALMLDAQDVYSRQDLEGILSFAERRPHAGQFQAFVHHYWKSLRYRVEPLDRTPRTILFKVAPGSHALPASLIPEEAGVCHNFSFASEDSLVLSRLKSVGFAEDDASKWKSDIWDGWDSNRILRNLHPEQAARFRQTRRISPAILPESMAGHPHLEFEVIGKEKAPVPACSAVFVAVQKDPEEILAFCRQLAGTVPDDCELIGCAYTENALAALATVPGLKVVRSPEEGGVSNAWLIGSAAATSDNLIFLKSDLSFEGDWIEGFIAAFERNVAGCVFLPRVESESAYSTLAFERQRGRFYGRQSTEEGPFNSETAQCWACHREQLCDLTGSLVVYLDDTLVGAPVLTAPDQKDQGLDAAEEPLATIVVPIFNNLHLTKNCLASIFRHTPAGLYELIVVDNGSTDGSWDYLQTLGSKHPQLKSIRNRRNLFFARGCNRGGWAAHGKNVVFLNNDTIVKPDWLAELLRPLGRDGSVGITGNKQVFPDSHPVCANRVWHAGMVVGSDRLPWHTCYGFDPAHPAVNRERDCQSVSGCCLAIRRDLFERLGGFDPHFQNGFEDVDLCLRAGELGYRIVYAPRSEIVHLVSSSESRFDREASNLERFKSRWSGKLVPDEEGFLRATGLLPETNDRAVTRVGFVSSYGQKSASSRNAERLLEKYPEGSTVVLSEFGTSDRRPEPDRLNVIRCWDRTGAWYYPLLRWATTLDLDLIHINFDPALFPAGFIELLDALKAAGKRMVFTMDRVGERTALLDSIARHADAVVVGKASHRSRLVAYGYAARTIHLIPAFDADSHWKLYREVLNGRTAPTARVRWEGPQLVNHSLALVNRAMETALLEFREVELTIAPVGSDAFAGMLQSELRALQAHYGRTLSGPPDVHVRHQWPPNWNPPQQGHWVVIQPWEYGGVPQEWIDAVQRNVDEVWAPSTFVRRLYVESGADPDRVHVVPNGVDTNFFKPGVKPLPLKSARKFRFLFLGGTIHRKGIDVLLAAYTRAFKPGDDVSLVIKDTGVSDVYRGQGMGQRIREMQADGSAPHIVYLEGDLTDSEMVQLYNACDCLVHPYRGEGFALPVLEAMACALPVVVTAGGATDDFVDESTGFRIPATKQVFGDRSISGLKTAGDLWLLEPDLEALTSSLVHVYANRERARETGRRARATVECAWTWKHAGEKALRRVEALKALPVFRHLRHVEAAVLLDLSDVEKLALVVDSIKRNSYTTLALYARARADAAGLDGFRQRHPDVEILEDRDFSASIEALRRRVRARRLVTVSEPLRFSKNWLKQLVEIGSREPGLCIVVPYVDPAASAEPEESEFQRLARVRWRKYRGVSREIEAISGGCAMANWECLSLGVNEPIHDSQTWLRVLQERGARIYLAEDTCVGDLPVSVPPPAIADRLGTPSAFPSMA